MVNRRKTLHWLAALLLQILFDFHLETLVRAAHQGCVLRSGLYKKTQPHSLKFYLSAVQIQVLVAHLQLQHLHLVVPLLHYGGVPHGPPVQSWFDPAHDLRKGQSNGSINIPESLSVHVLAERADEHTRSCALPSPPSVSSSGSHDGGWEPGTGAAGITVTDLLPAGSHLCLISCSLTTLSLQWRDNINEEDTGYYAAEARAELNDSGWTITI